MTEIIKKIQNITLNDEIVYAEGKNINLRISEVLKRKRVETCSTHE